MMTGAQLAILKTLLETDPDAVGLDIVGNTDVENADIFNTVGTLTAIVPRQRSRIKLYLAQLQLYSKLVSDAANETSPTRDLSLVFLDELSGGSDPLFYLPLAEIEPLLDAYIANPIFDFDATDKTNFIAFLSEPVTYAYYKFGVGVRVTPSDVSDARRLP